MNLRINNSKKINNYHLINDETILNVTLKNLADSTKSLYLSECPSPQPTCIPRNKNKLLQAKWSINIIPIEIFPEGVVYKYKIDNFDKYILITAYDSISIEKQFANLLQTGEIKTGKYKISLNYKVDKNECGFWHGTVTSNELLVYFTY